MARRGTRGDKKAKRGEKDGEEERIRLRGLKGNDAAPLIADILGPVIVAAATACVVAIGVSVIVAGEEG
jgi:hypothetical protein